MQRQPARRNDGRVLKKLNTMEIKSTKDSLCLRGTQIASLPEGLTIGGWLDLEGTQITSLPEGLTVGGWLDLRGTQITSLPEGLTVGGSLDLEGTQITGAQYNCGDEARAVYAYRHTSGKIVVSLGCFIGDEMEAVSAIRRKYGPDSEYEKRVIAAFEFARKRKK